MPLLVHHFIANIAKKIGKEISGISDQALLQISQYPWPGNVRELEHVLERACVLCHGTTITSEQLPAEIIHYCHGMQPRTVEEQQVIMPQVPVGNSQVFTPAHQMRENPAHQAQENLAPEERILNALRKSGGNKAKAARLLGIDRSTLYRKIKELQIDLTILDL